MHSNRKEGLVRSEKLKEGGRIKKQVYPVDWENLLPEDVKSKLFIEDKGQETEKVSPERHEPLRIPA
jgi:hypothetical protein